MLEVTSSVEEHRLGIDFAEIYRKSDLYQYVQELYSFWIVCSIFCFIYLILTIPLPLFCFRFNKRLVERLSKPTADSKDLDFPTKYCRSNFDQFVACLWKQHLSYWRNPQYTAVRFFYTVIISLMLGTICWDFGSKRYIPSTFIINILRKVTLDCYYVFSLNCQAKKSISYQPSGILLLNKLVRGHTLHHATKISYCKVSGSSTRRTYIDPLEMEDYILCAFESKNEFKLYNYGSATY